MVSTHLKNISQIGSFPQVGMNIKKYLKPPPGNGSIKNVQMTYFTPNKGGKENSKGSLQATIFSTMPTSNVCTIKTFTQQNRPTYLLYIKLCINHLKIQKKQKKTSFWHNLHMNCPKTTGVLTGNASFFFIFTRRSWHDTLFASICTAHMVRAARPTNTNKPEAGKAIF